MASRSQTGRQSFKLTRLSSKSNRDGCRVNHDTSVQIKPKFRNTLRHLRIRSIAFVNSLCMWKSEPEHPKVAVRQARYVAIKRSFIHIVPLLAAIALLVIQWINFLVAFDISGATWNALQFVAKIHEEFMIASIMEVLLHLVRTELINRFVPLGALQAFMQEMRLSYPWTFEFWSLFKSSAIKGLRKFLIAFSIIALVVLTNLVGPSSAILMIPKSDSPYRWPLGTRYVSNSTESMYPSVVGRNTGLTLDIRTVNLTANALFDQPTVYSWWQGETNLSLYSPQQMVDAQAASPVGSIFNRVIRLVWEDINDTTRKNDDADAWEVRQLNTTTPTLYSAAAFKSISKSYDQRSIDAGYGIVTLTATYPVVNTVCMAKTLQEVRLSTEIPYFADDGRISRSIITVGGLAEKASQSTESDGSRRYYAPVWLSSPNQRSASTVGIFISQELSTTSAKPLLQTLELAEGDKPLEDLEHSIRLYSCTVTAFWETGEVRLDSNNGLPAVMTKEYPKLRSSNARKITLNISELSTNASFHLKMAQMILSKGGTSNFFTAWVKTLPAAIVLALSEIPYVSTMQAGNETYIAGFENRMPSGQDAANITTFSFAQVGYGYGYGTRSTPIYLAMAVILTYCIIIASYVSYTIATGRSSSAWNLGIELITLALRSNRPDCLDHTAVGMHSIDTFSEPVGVWVSTQNELELVFAHDREFESRDMWKIEPNEEY